MLQYTNERPCVATELVEFRKRIGVEGVESIFKESIRVNGKDSDDDTLSADTRLFKKKTLPIPQMISCTKSNKRMQKYCSNREFGFKTKLHSHG
jgi:transposase, IS5 family